MNTLKSKDGNLAKLAVNKSLLKEYKTSDCDRTVYLNDGDEFQFQLFNPETTEIGIDITIDNEELSNIIILRPGERMWLERYTNKTKKFKFTTYTVDGDSKTVEKAISHNGEIIIKFYKKRQPVFYHPSSVTYVYPQTYVYPTYPNWYDGKIYCDYASSINDCDFKYTSATTSNASSAKYTTTGDINNPETISCCNYSLSFDSANTALNLCDSVIASASSAKAFDASNITRSRSKKLKDDNEIETGRVSEGSYSSQKFETVDIDLEYWPFKTETIKILPMSRKPYTATDTQKIYCPNCGRKLKTKFNYCPFCGEKID